MSQLFPPADIQRIGDFAVRCSAQIQSFNLAMSKSRDEKERKCQCGYFSIFKDLNYRVYRTEGLLCLISAGTFSFLIFSMGPLTLMETLKVKKP